MSKQPNCTKTSTNSSAYEKLFGENQDILEEVESRGHSINEFKGWLMRNDDPAPDKLTLTDVCHFLDWKESLKTVEIDESNFEQYFFDIRKNGPKPGQVLACYEAMADFVDGNMKRDVIHILMHSDKGGEAGPRLLRKLAGATESSAFRVIREMVKDLLSGMSSEEVAKKAYEMRCQHFYYTQKECLPEDDPHWWSTCLIDVNHPSQEEINRVMSELSQESQN